jgi:hypothetical protein
VVALLVRTAGVLNAQSPDGTHLQVFLMTMGAGSDISERFGHNALWIRDTVAGTDAIYNYGTYSFPVNFAGELTFGAQFAMGRPRYRLSVDTSLSRTLNEYRDAGRDLAVQELNLSPAEKADMASRLAVNAQPEHRYYTYDYYRDNCSTRVRDMIDVVLHGALRRATRDRPAGTTLRFHTLRSIENGLLLFVGIDAALGPRVDRPIDQWEEMFLPEKIALHLRELRVTDADGIDAPLVKSESQVLSIGRYRVETAPPRWELRYALVGLFVTGLVMAALLAGPLGAAGRLVATAWLALMALGGLLLLFFWLISYNVATYANHNLLLLSPIAIGALPSLWYRGPAPAARWRVRVVHALAISVLLGVAIALVPIVSRQDNMRVAWLTALPTLAAAYVAAKNLGRS